MLKGTMNRPGLIFLKSGKRYPLDKSRSTKLLNWFASVYALDSDLSAG